MVNPFVQFRPTEKLQLMLTVNNLFDTLGMAEFIEGSVPESGVVLGRSITGRTVSGSVRLSF